MKFGTVKTLQNSGSTVPLATMGRLVAATSTVVIVALTENPSLKTSLEARGHRLNAGRGAAISLQKLFELVSHAFTPYT